MPSERSYGYGLLPDHHARSCGQGLLPELPAVYSPGGIMRNKNYPLLIVAALCCLFLAVCLFLVLTDDPEKDGRLEGTVINSKSGNVVPGVDIYAEDEDGNAYTSSSNTDATLQDGSFSLVLPPGRYTVHCEAAGYQPYTSTSTYPVSSGETQIIPGSFALEPDESIVINESTTLTTTETSTQTTTETTTQTTTAAAPPTNRPEFTTITTTVREPLYDQQPVMSVDSSQQEDYSLNLSPYDYYSYYSDTDGFYFSYPPRLYNDVYSEYSPYETILGRNIETHTFKGSWGSSLTFSLSSRTDNLNLKAAKDRIYGAEASEITERRNKLLDEYVKEKGYSRFVVTGYNDYGNIIYKLVKVNPRNVMEMRIECPPYKNTDDEMQKRYVQECIYRWCGFASDKPGEPRTFTEFLKSDKK